LSKYQKNRKKTKKQSSYQGIAGLLPLAGILGVLPLIIYLRAVPVDPELQSYWTGANNMDFFSYYKSQFIIAMALLTFVVIFLKGSFQWNQHKKYYIPVGVLAAATLLSTVFATHRGIALSGFYDRYEGLYVLLSYMVLFIGAMNLVNTERQVKFLLGTLAISAGVMGVIGLSQFLNRDILANDFVKSLMVPAEYRSIASEIRINFGPRRVYGTLYNPNYVGSYVALLMPLGVIALYYFQRVWQKIAAALGLVLMLVLLLGSQSRAGFLGVGASMVLLMIFYRKTLLQQWKQSLATLLILILGVLGINSITDGNTLNRVLNFSVDRGIAYNHWDFEGIEGEGTRLTLQMKNQDLTLDIREGELLFFNETEEAIEYAVDPETSRVHFSSESFDSFNLRVDRYVEGLLVKQHIGGRELNFLGKDTGFYILGPHGETPAYEEIPAIGFEGYEQFASNRGHIWSRSFPLLQNTLIVGHGPDTFPLYFPQEDYIGKFQYHGTPTILVDKVHNMYLQTAVQTGIISLSAMLLLFGLYFWDSMRLYFTRRKSTFLEVGGFALFISIFAYLTAGFFNDSTVSVAPVFWVLLGLGVALNNQLTKEAS